MDGSSVGLPVRVEQHASQCSGALARYEVYLHRRDVADQLHHLFHLGAHSACDVWGMRGTQGALCCVPIGRCNLGYGAGVRIAKRIPVENAVNDTDEDQSRGVQMVSQEGKNLLCGNDGAPLLLVQGDVPV